MSQEPSFKNDKNIPPRFGNRQNGEEPGQAPKKGPKFSIYWIYAIIFAVLIGFQWYGSFTPTMEDIDQETFMKMLKQGDVSKYTIISNRNKVRVTLKETSLPKYEKELKT